MKANLYAMILVGTSVLAASNVYAAAGTVNFTGTILDSACTVDVASKNQTVDLGKYNKSEFTAVGSLTAAKRFNIVLADCPDTVTSAKVLFDGKPDLTDSNLLAIDDSIQDAATGVAINLMSADKNDLPLHGVNGYNYNLNTDSGVENTLAFYAQYKSTSSTVTAGPANSVANFSVTYN